jgi:hypothetical protein
VKSRAPIPLSMVAQDVSHRTGDHMTTRRITLWIPALAIIIGVVIALFWSRDREETSVADPPRTAGPAPSMVDVPLQKP